MPNPLTSSEMASSLPTGSTTGLLRTAFHWMRSRQTAEMVDYFLYEACRLDPELGRRARLVGWFGLLGFLFGMLYAEFYLIGGHIWGVWIVTICSLGFLATSFLMRALRSVAIGGNFLPAMMALGFTALCYVEGGMRGHAVAWLASVPLCAFLLVGKKAAGV